MCDKLGKSEYELKSFKFSADSLFSQKTFTTGYCQYIYSILPISEFWMNWSKATEIFIMLSWHVNYITGGRSVSAFVWPLFGSHLKPVFKCLHWQFFKYKNVPKCKVKMLFSSNYTEDMFASSSEGKGNVSGGVMSSSNTGHFGEEHSVVCRLIHYHQYHLLSGVSAPKSKHASGFWILSSVWL